MHLRPRSVTSLSKRLSHSRFVRREMLSMPASVPCVNHRSNRRSRRSPARCRRPSPVIIALRWRSISSTSGRDSKISNPLSEMQPDPNVRNRLKRLTRAGRRRCMHRRAGRPRPRKNPGRKSPGGQGRRVAPRRMPRSRPKVRNHIRPSLGSHRAVPERGNVVTLPVCEFDIPGEPTERKRRAGQEHQQRKKAELKAAAAHEADREPKKKHEECRKNHRAP